MSVMSKQTSTSFLYMNQLRVLVQPAQEHNDGKYDNNEKGLYFRFRDDNKMSYWYIFRSPTREWIHWTHTALFISVMMNKVTERINYNLHTLVT